MVLQKYKTDLVFIILGPIKKIINVDKLILISKMFNLP